MKKTITTAIALVAMLSLSGCSEPGSKGWCDSMKDKDKSQWTAEEAGIFTKHCVLGNYKE